MPRYCRRNGLQLSDSSTLFQRLANSTQIRDCEILQCELHLSDSNAQSKLTSWQLSMGQQHIWRLVQGLQHIWRLVQGQQHIQRLVQGLQHTAHMASSSGTVAHLASISGTVAHLASSSGTVAHLASSSGTLAYLASSSWTASSVQFRYTIAQYTSSSTEYLLLR